MADYKFTNKQLMFINHYLVCYNASEAARRAGYSEKTAGPIGRENLQKPAIKAEIERRIEEATLTADDALSLLMSHATGDVGEFLDEGGYFNLAAAKKAGKTHLIRDLDQYEVFTEGSDDKIDRTTRTRVKLYDSQAALKEILDRLRGRPMQRKEITGKDGGPLIIVRTGEDIDDL